MTGPQCVDVIIPVFNGRETIKAAIASVLTQQGDWIQRIIVVDDGSSDDTAQVVASLSSSKIELVRTSNQGVARARNLGIMMSRSEWVAFIDADDLWMPGKLHAQLEAAKAYGAGFLCGSVSESSEMHSGPISARLLARGNFVATSSVLVKRSVLQQIQPVFAPGMSFAEDYLAWLKCVTVASGYYLSNKIVDYKLSEHPRYRWGQIVKNIIDLNRLYDRFLHQNGVESGQRLYMVFAVFVGSLRAMLSIMKRFIRSYLAGIARE